jgi:hypothetical protein
VGERSLHTREVAGSKPAAPISRKPRHGGCCAKPASAGFGCSRGGVRGAGAGLGLPCANPGGAPVSAVERGVELEKVVTCDGSLGQPVEQQRDPGFAQQPHGGAFCFVLAGAGRPPGAIGSALEAQTRRRDRGGQESGRHPAHDLSGAPGIQFVPASGTRAMAAASTVSATRSSGSRFWTWDLPHARASVWVSRTMVRR